MKNPFEAPFVLLIVNLESSSYLLIWKVESESFEIAEYHLHVSG